MRSFLYLFTLFTSFLAADEGSKGSSTNMNQALIMVGIALVFFYLILWRPEQKKRAKRNALKKGDKVSAVGIIGTIAKIEEETIILEMVDGNKIEVIKAAVNEVGSRGTPAT